MGDVYLAEDTKLDRKVALKVLPPHLAENEERRARFQREAKALAALDHANIVQVFSVEEAEGNHFITMQLVQGKTLTELIPTSGFALNKFFEVAIPLADAVAAAHQEGITHRDLKPDNVMVSEDGRVTVLDFGLAKPTPGFATEGSESPTQAKTAEGTIVGTLNYMSPEQTQGKTVDARSDIFSLGIIFYETLTGRRPFTGETPAEVLSSINKDAPPPVTESRPQVPRALSRIVQRCLVKDPTRRAQSALDVRNELEELKAELGSGELQEGAPPVGSSVNKWLLAAVIVSLLALAGVFAYYRRAPESSVPRLTFLRARQVTSAAGVETYPTWSPDGGRIAYEGGGGFGGVSGNWDIWVSQLGGGEPVNLTEDHKEHDRFPSWSPDGGRIVFLLSETKAGACTSCRHSGAALESW